MPLDRVVFDTNVWITYFYNGEFKELVDIAEVQEIRIFSCLRLRNELASVLIRPKFKKKLRLKVDRYIAFYEKLCVEITIDERFDRIKDLKDNYIVDLAYSAKCSHIITGDPHLLSVKHIGKIQIISLSDFKKRISRGSTKA